MLVTLFFESGSTKGDEHVIMEVLDELSLSRQGEKAFEAFEQEGATAHLLRICRASFETSRGLSTALQLLIRCFKIDRAASHPERTIGSSRSGSHAEHHAGNLGRIQCSQRQTFILADFLLHHARHLISLCFSTSVHGNGPSSRYFLVSAFLGALKELREGSPPTGKKRKFADEYPMESTQSKFSFYSLEILHGLSSAASEVHCFRHEAPLASKTLALVHFIARASSYETDDRTFSSSQGPLYSEVEGAAGGTLVEGGSEGEAAARPACRDLLSAATSLILHIASDASDAPSFGNGNSVVHRRPCRLIGEAFGDVVLGSAALCLATILSGILKTAIERREDVRTSANMCTMDDELVVNISPIVKILASMQIFRVLEAASETDKDLVELLLCFVEIQLRLRYLFPSLTAISATARSSSSEESKDSATGGALIDLQRLISAIDSKLLFVWFLHTALCCDSTLLVDLLSGTETRALEYMLRLTRELNRSTAECANGALVSDLTGASAKYCELKAASLETSEKGETLDSKATGLASSFASDYPTCKVAIWLSREAIVRSSKVSLKSAYAVQSATPPTSIKMRIPDFLWHSHRPMRPQGSDHTCRRDIPRPHEVEAQVTCCLKQLSASLERSSAQLPFDPALLCGRLNRITMKV